MPDPGAAAVLMQEDWAQLWTAAATVDPRDPQSALYPIGLLLEPPDQPRRLGYDSTPVGAVTFASTGGDGVHFSGVVASDGDLVIVMTVPMQWDHPNIVVGRSIREFLDLGCRHRGGYFTLEQLAYDWDSTIADLETGNPAEPDGEVNVELGFLRDRFGLAPWPELGRRLESLQPLLPA